MKWQLKFPKGDIKVLAEKEGESIEEMLRKATGDNDPIKNTAPLIYTERKQGVLPEYDHRTDRFEIARQATDRVHGTRAASRDQQIEAAVEQIQQDVKNGKPIAEA